MNRKTGSEVVSRRKMYLVSVAMVTIFLTLITRNTIHSVRIHNLIRLPDLRNSSESNGNPELLSLGAEGVLADEFFPRKYTFVHLVLCTS